MRVALSLMLALAGCGDPATDTSREERPTTNSELGGDVVSIANGVPITVSDVRALCESSGLAPEEALKRLQDEVLLGQEAARRGYGDRRVVRQTTERALVQRVLRDLEEEVSQGDVPAETLEQAREQTRETGSAPTRGVRHALLRIEEGASDEERDRVRARAERALVQLREAENPVSVFDELEDRDWLVEEIPPTTEESPFDPAFVQALFAAPEVGVIDHPVATAFGIHLMQVTSIREVDPSDATAAERRAKEAALAVVRFHALSTQTNPQVAEAEVNEARVSAALSEVGP